MTLHSLLTVHNLTHTCVSVWMLGVRMYAKHMNKLPAAVPRVFHTLAFLFCDALKQKVELFGKYLYFIVVFLVCRRAIAGLDSAPPICQPHLVDITVSLGYLTQAAIIHHYIVQRNARESSEYNVCDAFRPFKFHIAERRRRKKCRRQK